MSRYIEIINMLSDFDYDIAINELRNLESENVITSNEYNYIINNYDKLIKESESE